MEHDVDVIAENVVRSRYERSIIVVRTCYNRSKIVLQSNNSWYGRSENMMSVDKILISVARSQNKRSENVV